jgi:hypothetical protein
MDIYETYPIFCILPRSRYVVLTEDQQVRTLDVDVDNAIHDQKPIKLYKENNESYEIKSMEELSSELGFIHSPRIQFLHETDLRGSVYWGMADACQQTSSDIGIFEKLNSSYIHDDLSIRYINADIGFGVFADSPVLENCFLGEYTGIISSTTNFSDYSLMYPSSDGGFEISALECGNLIRFINHSNIPNSKFCHVFHENIMHVVCMTITNVQKDDQITVDYGMSYWSARGIIPQDNS